MAALFASLFAARPAQASVNSWSLQDPVFTGDVLAVGSGNAGWVAVGTGGSLATSPDGVTWTIGNSGVSTDLRAVTWGGGKYFVAAADGTVLESADAATWSVGRPASTASSAISLGAAYGAGKCVVVRSDGTVLTSSDGTVWTVEALTGSAGAIGLTAITFGNGIFVTVGTYPSGYSTLPVIFTSPDGTNWTQRANQSFDAGNGASLSAVTWGGGQFVAGGAAGWTMISPDGVTWTAVTGGYESADVSGIAFGNSGYLAGESNYYSYLASPDGVNWTSHDVPINDGQFEFTSIAFSGDRFVAGARNGEIAVKIGDSDWQVVVGIPTVANPSGIAYGNGRYVITGSDSSTCVSSDGQSWIKKGGYGYGYSRPAFGNGTFAAISYNGSNYSAYTSTDGLNWTQGGTVPNLSALIYTRGQFLGGGFGAFASSTDGATWTALTAPAQVNYAGLADGNGRLVAVGYYAGAGACATSDDGVTWTARAGPTSMPLQAIAFGAGRFVAVEQTTVTAWTSTDGLNWSQVNLPTPANGRYTASGFNDIIFAGGWFAATVGSDLLYSADGINWTVMPKVFGSENFPQFFLTYGNGSFVATGRGGAIYQSSPDATAILLAPVSTYQIVPSGQPATVSVTATGTAITFQWYAGASGDTSSPIAGANATSLSVNPAPADGTYWVRVSNGTTFVDSKTFTVETAVPPSFPSAPPTDQEALVGQTVTFSDPAIGTPTPTVQWFEGKPGDVTMPVSGAVAQSLSVIAGTQARRFWARATNSAGSADSTEMRFTPWTKTEPLSLSNVRQIGGQLIGVGGNTLSTSPNGVTWTALGTSFNSSLTDIAQGSGLYVAVGPTGFFTSSDLQTWTQRNLPANPATYNGAASLAFGNGVFVAAGSASYVSSDGISWSPISLPTGISLTSVVFGGSRFVAVGQDNSDPDLLFGDVGAVFTSTDGAVWTRVGLDALPETSDNESTTLTSIVCVGGNYVAISNTGYLALVSSDGVNWSRINLGTFAGRPTCSGFVDGQYLIGTDFGGRYFSSADARTWTVRAAPSGFAPASFVSSGSQLLAISSGGGAFTTSDGFNWVQLSGGAPSEIGNMAFGAGRLIAFESSGTYTSFDGFNWQESDPEGNNLITGLIAYVPGHFVATSQKAGVTYQSPDGRIWTSTPTPAASSPNAAVFVAGSQIFFPTNLTQAITFGAGRYVAVSNSQLSVSTDGVSWTPAPSVPSGYLFQGVAFGNGTFAAVGFLNSGLTAIATSQDGLTWVGHPLPASNVNMATISYIGDQFLSATSAGLEWSQDGINWQTNSAIAVGEGPLTLANGKVLAGSAWHRSADISLPVIASTSPSIEIASGTSTMLSVSAIGDGLSYQWYSGLPEDTTNPIVGATGTSFTTAPAAATQNYWVRVLNPNGFVDSSGILVSLAAPPVITSQPFSADIIAGQYPVLLQVTASSASPLAYQWYQGPPGYTLEPIGGGISPELLVSPANTTSYWVRISNSHGFTDSIAATVTPWTQGAFVSPGSNPVYPTSYLSTTGLAYGAGRFVVTGHSYNVTSSGFVEVSPDGSNWTAYPTAAALKAVAYGVGNFVALAISPSTAVYRSIDGIAWTQATISGTNTIFSNLTFQGGLFFATSATGTLGTSQDGINWVAHSLGTQAIAGVAYGNGTYVACGGGLFTSSDGNSWTPVSGNFAAGAVSVTFGGGEFVAVGSDGTLCSSADGMNWSVLPAGLTSDNWTALPANQSLHYVNGHFYGSPSFSSSGFYYYMSDDLQRWWIDPFGTNLSVSGGGTVLGISGQGGYFSPVAPVTPPILTTEPASQVVSAGQTVTLSVSATSSTPVAYQWIENGAAIAGATNPTLVLTNFQAANGGTYLALMTNAAGSIQSSPTQLTTTALTIPNIATQPVGQVVAVGSAASLSVAATDTAGLSYQWFKNGASIPGATNSILAFAAAQDGDGAAYTVAVSDGIGSAFSASANLCVVSSVSQSLVGGGYTPAGGMLVLNTVTFSGPATGLTWQTSLPAGWTCTYDTAASATSRPAAGASGTVEWQWTNAPSSPATFAYVLSAPAGSAGTCTLSSMATLQSGTASLQLSSQPAPLSVQMRHSADTNGDGTIDLPELTRVIELYNVHNGSTRTGAYVVNPTGEDGFATDPTRTPLTSASLPLYHTADESRNGTIDLADLTRMIELYNYHNGPTRTGQYHAQSGTEDGFAPGP